jgi:hypothetical protein
MWQTGSHTSKIEILALATNPNCLSEHAGENDHLMSAPGPTTIIRKKKRRRRRAPVLPFLLLVLAIVSLLAGGVWLFRKRPIVSATVLPEGYISDAATLKKEFGLYYGNDEGVENATASFRSAADLAKKRNFAGVASLLESAAKTAPVPVVYHDLGIGYALLGDSTRAADAFREALARDPEYSSTRKYLRETRGIPPGAAEPFTRESEPNNDRLHANLIALKTPVAGEIAGAADGDDLFRFIAPPAPRDLVSIEVTNHSAAFRPRVHVYDDQFRVLSWQETSDAAGSLRVVGGPSPNAVVYVSITSDDGKPGQYLLTVTPTRAFDRFEPNNTIVEARRITIGEEVPANVMDTSDVDFYAFTSPRKGKITVEIRNRSNTLKPVLGVYDNDRRNIALVQNPEKPDGNLRHIIDAEKDQVYYLQVSSQGGSAGAYTLRVD